MNEKIKRQERELQRRSKIEEKLKQQELLTILAKKNEKDVNVRLPKLELRKFKGDLMKWTEFWEQYHVSIHINKNLGTLEKFTYRKSEEGHLKVQLKRLRKTPELLEAYDEVIQKQKHDGIVEPAPKEPTGERITYIPHQAVIRENTETTKLRIVYDASAKLTKGSKSLNNCLHTGPSRTPLLYDVLLR